MSRLSIWAVTSVPLVLASTCMVASTAAQVSSADEICAPDAAPCIVTRSVSVADGAVLDFGARELRIEAGGQLDGGDGSWSVICGSFFTDVGRAVAIKARGRNGLGLVDGGTFALTAYRQCSALDEVRCLDDDDCDLGTCSLRRCDEDAQEICSNDDDCQLGACTNFPTCVGAPSRECQSDGDCSFGQCDLRHLRCSNNSSVFCFLDSHCELGPCELSRSRCGSRLGRSCSDDSDCDLGLCGVELCSHSVEGVYHVCSSDGDCVGGQCSIGTGNIVVDGKVRAGGDFAGEVTIIAAGSIDIKRRLEVNGTNGSSDGGFVRISAGAGALTIDADIKARGKGSATGGDLELSSRRSDVVIDATVDVGGGEFDGGFLAVKAENDVRISGSIDLSASNRGDGFGGDLEITAGQDISLVGMASLKTNGHAATRIGSGGHGGFQDYFAEGNFSCDTGVLMQSNGAKPDGFGGDFDIRAGGTATIGCEIESRARGNDGFGGDVDMTAGGLLTIRDGALIDITGGLGAGNVDLMTNNDLFFVGAIVAASGDASTSCAGDVFFDVGKHATIAGSITTSGDGDVDSCGREGGLFELSACDINFAAGSIVDNSGDAGVNRLIGREQIVIASGAALIAGTATGANAMIYREASKPPLIIGTVIPAALVTLDPTLTNCPACGNAELETGETCDDGNRVNGDGCSDTCQDEACIAQTAPPGYPAVPLCDDGEPCTADSCDSQAGCQHVAVADGADCRDDDVCNGSESCRDGSCVSGLPMSCDDGRFCNGVEICVSGSGCRRGAPIDCSDGVLCTVDTCSDPQARCVNTPTPSLCDDSEQCTVDSCDGVIGCGHADSEAACDDGVSCTVGDVCSGGVCIGTSSCPSGQVCDLITGECSVSTTTTLPASVCGDGRVRIGETCDDGDTVWQRGEHCSADCRVLLCGDPDDSGSVTSSDALLALRAAVSGSGCDDCICDVNNAGGATASDALRILHFAVGLLGVSLDCGACQ